jgi:CRISPR/Cas system-associated exonuclease Cas4 (RecB family)
MIAFLTVLLATMSATLLGTLHQSGQRARVAAEIPPGYKIHAADLGHGEAMGSKSRLLLVDNEWGLCGAPDLLLEGPEGVVPVEMKRAWKRYQPGTSRPSHIMQLGVLLVLCAADRRVGQRPREGWIRYTDEGGRTVQGGEVRIENTEHLRATVVTLVQQMRRATKVGAEVHRDHRSRWKCARCALHDQCGEAIA